MTQKPRTCAVLLCTFNGARYLDEQLRSLAGQTLGAVNIYASDDGSTDETIAILERWQRDWSKGRFRIESGPRRGFAQNFRSLVLQAGADEFFAFCDQDDIWHPEKLEAGITQLAPHHVTPALYGCRSVLVDQDGTRIGLSPMFSRRPGFGNALIQSLAAGNTMVLNAAGFALLAESARRTEFLMHDWWAYLIVSGAGGTVLYDHTPHLDYRQHGHNVLGGRLSLSKRPARLLELLKGKYNTWNDANILSLERCTDLLSPKARETLANFKYVRSHRGLASVLKLANSGLYRQTRKGDVALWVAAFLGKL